MTSQSSLMVAARLDRKSVDGLKALLATMNFAPGRVNAANPLVPFEKLETLHFARFVILDDSTLDDIRLLYGLPRQEYPLYLAFLCDFDGPKPDFLSDLIQHAGPGLRRVFAFCDGFVEGSDLLQWIRDHDLPVAANYVNWRGRTVKQVHEEAKLRAAIDTYLHDNAAGLEDQPAEQVRLQVRAFVNTKIARAELKLTPSEPTPWGERIGNLANLIWNVFLILVQGIVAVPLFFRIHHLEKTDPVYAPRPCPDQAKQLAEIEDFEFTNQFSAMGSWKPGWDRRFMAKFVLRVINLTARYWLFTTGRLARVRTIHFARWVFLDKTKRILFASNYDGSLDSYNDDFINKVSIGLNLAFTNGIGYPSTRWMVAGGAKDEQKFKYFLRRHQMPTQVWYNAHPSMTAVDLEKNSRIRQGLAPAALSDKEALEWVRLL